MTAAVLAGLAGLGLGLSLIVAIGAQNAFVLRQGLRREHIATVIVICAISDAALIAGGIAGAGWVFERFPWLVEAVRWAGAVFLLGYGVLAARRAIRPKALAAASEAPDGSSLLAIAGTTLALTWLNPHVYLDTLVLLGSVASTHDELRWAFGAGAMLGSVLWFTALGLGARVLGPVFARPTAWRVLDGAIAVIMVVLAVGLVLPPALG